MMYTLATPLVWVSAIMFYSTHMQTDLLCSLAHIRTTEFDVDECFSCLNSKTDCTIDGAAATYDSMYALAISNADWRWPLYQASVIIPCIYSVIEVCLNKLNLRYRHWVIVLIFCVVYEAINAAGFFWFDKTPSYPNLLEWDCFEREDCDIFSEFFLF
jgi:hypothetical protein